jgi:putative NADH-flavin reductase
MAEIKNVMVVGVRHFATPCYLTNLTGTGRFPKQPLIQSQASGQLGPAIVSALLDAGFHVTALTRTTTITTSSSSPSIAPSPSTLPPSIPTISADYTSLPSLTAAFQGQDAVVSSVSSTPAATRSQMLLIDAAVAAGVKRFLPSEYGVNSQTLPPGLKELRGDKSRVVEYLRGKESEGFGWTGLSTGQFFDWVSARVCLSLHWFGIDFWAGDSVLPLAWS